MESGEIRLRRTNEWFDKISVNADGTATFTLANGRTYTAKITDQHDRDIKITDKAVWQDVADELVSMLKKKGLIPVDGAAQTEQIRVNDRQVRRGKTKFSHREQDHGHRQTEEEYEHLSEIINRVATPPASPPPKRKARTSSPGDDGALRFHPPAPSAPNEQLEATLGHFNHAIGGMSAAIRDLHDAIDENERRNATFMRQMQESVGEQGQAYMQSLMERGQAFAEEIQGLAAHHQKLAADAQRQVSDLVGTYQARLGELQIHDRTQQEFISMQMRALEDLEERAQRAEELIRGFNPQVQTSPELVEVLRTTQDNIRQIHELLQRLIQAPAPSGDQSNDALDQLQQRNADLEAHVQALSAELDTLRQKVEELSQRPVGDPEAERILEYQRQILNYALENLANAAQGLPTSLSLADELAEVDPNYMQLPPGIDLDRMPERTRAELEQSVLPILRYANEISNAIGDNEVPEIAPAPAFSEPNNQELELLQTQNAGLRNAARQLSEQIQRLQGALEASEHQRLDYKQRLDTRDGRAQESKAQIRALEEELADSRKGWVPKREIDREKRRAHDLQTRLAEIEPKVALYEAIGRENERLLERLREANEKSFTLQRQLDRVKVNLHNTGGTLAAARGEADVREPRIRELSNELIKVRRESEEQIAALQKANANLARQVEERDAYLSEQQEEIRERTWAEFRQKTEAFVQEKLDEIARLQAEIAQLKGE